MSAAPYKGDEDFDVVWVMVPLSRAEYRRMRHRRAFTAPGATWAAVREAMNLHHSPRLFKSGRHIARHEGPRPWAASTEDGIT